MKIISFNRGYNKLVEADELLNLTKVTPQQARQLDTDYLLKYRYFTILENNGQESNWYVDESDTDTAENGGTCMVSTSGVRLKRNLVNGRGYINSDWFGLKSDCIYDFNGTAIPTGTDNSELLQKAIDATPVGGVLSIPCGTYLFNAKVVLDKSIDIIADKGTVFVADLVDKTKEFLRVGGAVRGKMANFWVVGAGYQCLSGIRFVLPDSQAIELDNIKVTQCRYGIYSNEGETINRIIIRNCDFTSNSIAGFYLKSFDVQYEHSAPITFEHTIVNSNGPQDWMYNTTYKGQPILDATDKFGYQIYCKGFGKLTWKGGQISNHAQAKNIAMAYFESGSGLSIYCPDFEDFTSCCNHNGDLILPDFSNIQSEDEGSAIVIKSVKGVFAEMSHVWQINSQSIFKLLYDCGDATILNVPKVGQLKYTIDVSGANQGVNTTRLYTNSDLSLLSPSAFNSISTEMLNLIDEQNNLVPNNSHNTVFDNVTVTSGKYTFGYCLDINNPNFRNAAYSERDVVGNEKVIFAELECTQGSFPSQGAFFVESLNSTGNRLGFAWIETKGMYSYAGSYFAYLHYLLPENTAKIRYGFTCKGNFTGSIPTHATVKSFRIFSYTNSRSGLTKSDRKNGLERNIQFLDAIPTNPTVPVNFEKGVFYLNGVDTLGWYCSKSGTISNSTTSCNANAGDSFVTVTSVYNLQKGQYVNIEGVSGTYKITDILGMSVFLSSALTTNIVNKTLSFSAPKLNRIDSNSIDWVFVNFANYTPSLIDKYIEFDASSTSIFVNMPDATTNAGRQLTMKRIDGSSNFVTLSGSIEGNTLRLRQNEYLCLISDGIRWCILGQNKPSFGSINFDTGTAVVTNSQLTLNAKISISIQAFNTGAIPSAIEYVASTGSVTFYAKKADKSIETLCNATIIYQILAY